jgi:hypothetical protein
MTEPRTAAGRAHVANDPKNLAYVIAIEDQQERIDMDATRADAAAQTATAVEALRDAQEALLVAIRRREATPTQQERDAEAKALRVINVLSAAAEVHDKAVAERAVHGWLVSESGVVAFRDGLYAAIEAGKTDIVDNVTQPDGDVMAASVPAPVFANRVRGAIVRALTTQEAESAGEGS